MGGVCVWEHGKALPHLPHFSILRASLGLVRDHSLEAALGFLGVGGGAESRAKSSRWGTS